MTNYNPYNLVAMSINGTEIYGRPMEFDSEIVDFQKMINAFGYAVKPSKLSTICPNCGQGLEVVVSLPDPPFPVVEYTCQYCNPSITPISEPFNNPIETGRISQHELDPLLYDMSKKLQPSEQSVAERLTFENIITEEPVVEEPVVEEPVVEEPVVEEPVQQNEHEIVFPNGSSIRSLVEEPVVEEPVAVEEPQGGLSLDLPDAPIAEINEDLVNLLEGGTKKKKPKKSPKRPITDKPFDDTNLAEPE